MTQQCRNRLLAGQHFLETFTPWRPPKTALSPAMAQSLQFPFKRDFLPRSDLSEIRTLPSRRLAGAAP
jgi:hypothetical protein